MQRHSFRKVSGESPETMRKLCLSSKFPHKEIRWFYGILRSTLCATFYNLNHFQPFSYFLVVLNFGSFYLKLMSYNFTYNLRLYQKRVCGTDVFLHILRNFVVRHNHFPNLQLPCNSLTLLKIGSNKKIPSPLPVFPYNFSKLRD